MAKMSTQERRRREASSGRTAKVHAATIRAAVREAEHGTPMADTASEDGRYDALRAVASDAIAQLAEHGHGDMIGETAQALGMSVADLEAWAGDSSAHIRRRIMADHRANETARARLARARLAGTVHAATLRAVTVRTDGAIAAAEVRTARTVDRRLTGATAAAERSIERASKVPAAAMVDPWAILADAMAQRASVDA